MQIICIQSPQHAESSKLKANALTTTKIGLTLAKDLLVERGSRQTCQPRTTLQLQSTPNVQSILILSKLKVNQKIATKIGYL